jgi:hypothetical protein
MAKRNPEIAPNRPLCTRCQLPMVTISASLAAGGLEERTFECLKCGHVFTLRTPDNLQPRNFGDSIEIGYFKVGDRFRMSTLGAQRCPRLSNKVGTVTSIIENSQTVCVRFDGNKMPTSLHRNYIEPL